MNLLSQDCGLVSSTDVSSNSSTDDVSSNSKETSTPRRAQSNMSKFSLNLEKFEEGDVPLELGKDVLVKKSGQLPQKVAIGITNNSRLEIKKLSLSNSFEIDIFGIWWVNNADQGGINEIILKSNSNSVTIKFTMVRFWKKYIEFGPYKYHVETKVGNKWGKIWQGGRYNKIKLKSKGRVLKLFLNGEFFGSVIHDSKFVYSDLLISLSQSNAIADVIAYNL